MKKIVILTAVICLCISAFAQKSVQSIKYEGVLAQAITQERYNKLMTQSPSKLLDTYYDVTGFCYVTNQLPENAVVMGDICSCISPNENCDDASTVATSKQINHRKYAMQREEVRYVAYTLGNTGSYVVVYPLGVYQKNRNAFMKEYGY